MLFVYYPKCTTCQKAQRWLEAHGVCYTLRDIKLENPSYDELRAWHERSGLPLRKFFNTSGLLYKSLGLKEKLPAMSEEEQLRLLATDGMLCKRPLLIGAGFVLVGFNETAWEATVNESKVST
jgi:arsenate reductase